MLRCAEKIPSKRKATKDPSEPRPKKVSRKAYGQKKSRKPRKLILNETDEDREKAETEATLAKVAKLEAKEKEKEAERKAQEKQKEKEAKERAKRINNNPLVKIAKSSIHSVGREYGKKLIRGLLGTFLK